MCALRSRSWSEETRAAIYQCVRSAGKEGVTIRSIVEDHPEIRAFFLAPYGRREEPLPDNEKNRPYVEDRVREVLMSAVTPLNEREYLPYHTWGGVPLWVAVDQVPLDSPVRLQISLRRHSFSRTVFARTSTTPQEQRQEAVEAINKAEQAFAESAQRQAQPR